MQCQTCGYENATTEVYCRACGKKIKYVISKVKDSLIDTANNMAEEQTEEQMRNLLVSSIALFLVAVTLKVAFHSWPVFYTVPGSSQSRNAKYAKVEYVPDPRKELEKNVQVLDIPK